MFDNPTAPFGKMNGQRVVFVLVQLDGGLDDQASLCQTIECCQLFREINWMTQGHDDCTSKEAN